MATAWDGKSRGSVLGYKIYVQVIKKLGLIPSYILLAFVVLYFCFFSRKNVRALFYYLHNRQKYSYGKSILHVYLGYYKFGQMLIDKISVAAGLGHRYTYEFDGKKHINHALDKKRGLLLISAHVGNFELAEFFFHNLKRETPVNLIVTDREHKDIRNYLSQFLRRTATQFILIEDDMSHIFKINAALARNEIVCISGDRYIDVANSLKHVFLGKEARFPTGPFILGSRLKAPVLFVYVMKEGLRHYHLYAREAQVMYRDNQDLFVQYIASLEGILSKYPLQWFNYYDFWNVFKSPKHE